MFQFSIFKIPVTVQGWFFLLAAFLGGGLRASTPQEWQGVLLFIAAAFVSILIHELGHALAGLKFGAPSVQVSLNGMGGLSSFPGASFSRKHRILMTAAGPASSIALAVVFFAIAIFLLPAGSSPYASPSLIDQFVGTMVGINVFWTFINICPVLPLDGGQMLRDLLGPSRIKLTCIISFITLGILAFFLWNYTRSIYNLVIMAFLGSYTWRVFQQVSR